MILAVAGCVAQAEGARNPGPRAVSWTSCSGRRPITGCRRWSPARSARRRSGDRDRFSGRGEVRLLPDAAAPQGVTAFLTIQEGCDKFCSFCVVPYTRGAEQSRPAAAVMAEARRLVAQGAREITLLGQNVNAWHGEAPDGGTWGLGALLRALAALPGLQRLRYTTSHPRDMDDALIAAHRDLPALMPFLHLPVQSGSDRMLAAMNRKHTADRLPPPGRALRAARPDLALSSRFHRRPSRRDRGGFRGHADAGARGRLRRRRSASIFAPARHAGRRRAGQVPEAEKDRAPAGVAGAAARTTGRVQRRLRRTDAAGAVHRSRPPSGPDRRTVTISSAGARRRPPA